ncbi:hypothetical protein C8R43DRAFT_1118885 [Mycena crocata]|nr:hypothetical protein C8R43DRAFT_1118885 [Mycena crocata]
MLQCICSILSTYAAAYFPACGDSLYRFQLEAPWLELATLRTRQQITAVQVKGRVVEKREDRRREEQRGKQEERMMKLRMKELKMRNTHELRMAATRSGPLSSTHSHAAGFHDGHSRSSGSNYTSSSSEPPDYPEFDGFNGNALAGPSVAATSGREVDFAGFDFTTLGTGDNHFTS